MNVEQFDAAINKAVDAFIDEVVILKGKLEGAIDLACQDAAAHNLPEHLCIASIAAGMKRMEVLNG
ncbi:hypothetical protein J1C56_02440 [Aminobacter anthyllidis]|uniref:Uncharacterized protein n=1 Tax=Aminobacter anthyllidis TaxID=1035067 RepID=A0A9X1D4A1_9HYPH|nr:hypothetical protein [Aminobacter anthyllidis]MBT1154443.1 hypothetical protein [Aminobacter anthyllidis]